MMAFSSHTNVPEEYGMCLVRIPVMFPQGLCHPELSVDTAFLFKSGRWLPCQLPGGRIAASWSEVADPSVTC